MRMSRKYVCCPILISNQTLGMGFLMEFIPWGAGMIYDMGIAVYVLIGFGGLFGLFSAENFIGCIRICRWPKTL